MYRKFNEADLELLKEEIAKDPVHGKDSAFTSDVFTDKNGQTLVFEDNEGPVFFVNLRKEIRLTIQFRDGINPVRTRDTFKRYVPLFAQAFKNAGCTAMTYTTQNKALAWFLRKFGFVKEETQRMAL